jgi:hypothetical protein
MSVLSNKGPVPGLNFKSGNLQTAQSQGFLSRAFARPPVALTSRTIMPSFASSSVSVSQSENILAPITVPNSLQIGSAAFATATVQQPFQALGSLKLSPWDTGQITFHNISVDAYDGELIVGHPQLQLVDAANNVYPAGMLVPGQAHQGLSVAAVVPLYSPNGSAPGSINLRVTGLLMGTANNH